MTFSILPPPRSCFALVSPITQRMASEIFDLPEPFGPTTAVMPRSIVMRVLSGNDLNPWISSAFKTIGGISFPRVFAKRAVRSIAHQRQRLFGSGLFGLLFGMALAAADAV